MKQHGSSLPITPARILDFLFYFSLRYVKLISYTKGDTLAKRMLRLTADENANVFSSSGSALLATIRG